MPIRIFDPERDGRPTSLGPGVDATVIVEGGGDVRHSVMVRLRIAAGRGYVSSVPVGSEDAWYVIEGRGQAVDLATGRSEPIEPRCLVAIDPGSRVAIRAGDRPMVLVGGPTPPGTPLGVAEAH